LDRPLFRIIKIYNNSYVMHIIHIQHIILYTYYLGVKNDNEDRQENDIKNRVNKG
jgi:hypothetical protein